MMIVHLFCSNINREMLITVKIDNLYKPEQSRNINLKVEASLLSELRINFPLKTDLFKHSFKLAITEAD